MNVKVSFFDTNGREAYSRVVPAATYGEWIGFRPVTFEAKEKTHISYVEIGATKDGSAVTNEKGDGPCRTPLDITLEPGETITFG